MGKYPKNNANKKEHIQGESKATVQKDSFFVNPGKTKATKPFQKERNKINHKAYNPANPTAVDDKTETNKKPFDKKQWRIKKYSNKYKIEKWQEMRKKKIINQYNKITKRKDDKRLDVRKIYEKYGEENSESEGEPESSQEKADPSKEETADKTKTPNNRRQTHMSRQERIQEIKEEKMRKREEILKKKAEREEAIKLMRKKKAERHKKLNKKTKKGQPIMKDRMKMLAEQVQRICQE